MIQKTELRRAAVFHAIASEGGIAAAARRLGKSAPAVHHDLKRFEADTGHALFERVGRGLQLTPAGRLLHESIGRALQDIDLARAQLAQNDPSISALRIGAVSGYGRYVLAPRLFAATQAGRRIQLQFGEHDRIVESLLARRLDLGVTFRQVVSTPIQCSAVAHEEIVLVVAAALPAATTWEALDAVPYVTYDEYEYVFGLWFDTVVGRQPPSLKRGDHVTELEEAMESVASGRGISIVPRDILDHSQWRGRVRELRPGGRAARNTLYLLSIGAATPDVEFMAGLLSAKGAPATPARP